MTSRLLKEDTKISYDLQRSPFPQEKQVFHSSQIAKEYISHLPRSLCRSVVERGYVRSEEAEQKREQLKKNERKEFFDADSNEDRKWKEKLRGSREEQRKFNEALSHDEDLERRCTLSLFTIGLPPQILLINGECARAQSLVEKASWLWQVIFNIHLPRAMHVLKEIPIPGYVCCVCAKHGCR